MKYLILGSSAAGINGAREIRRLDPKGEITIISKDKTIYSRCIMHLHVAGQRTLERLNFVDDDFLEKYNINYIGDSNVINLDWKNKVVELEKGDKISYDKLLIATGSKTFFPPIKNLDKAKNALGFRNFEDALELMELIKDKDNIVVVGAGLVGMDAVTGLLGRNKNISIVEMSNRVLSVQLDKRAASVYEKAFQDKGVRFYFGTGVTMVNLDEENKVKSVTLGSDVEIPCEILIVAAGVRPNTEFLIDTGIEMERGGLVIDTKGRTNVPDVYGAGDVTGWGPIWPVAVKEGVIAGSNMAGIDREMTDFFCNKSTMNYFGIPTMSLGISEPPDESYKVEIEEDNNGNYKKIIQKDGIIKGAILQGDLSYSGTITQLIRENIDVTKVKKPLFKIDYSDFFHVKDNFEFSYEKLDN